MYGFAEKPYCYDTPSAIESRTTNQPFLHLQYGIFQSMNISKDR